MKITVHVEGIDELKNGSRTRVHEAVKVLHAEMNEHRLAILEGVRTDGQHIDTIRDQYVEAADATTALDRLRLAFDPPNNPT